MKLQINRQEFAQAFQLAAAVAPARSPKPILQNIKIDASGDVTILNATDQEIGVRLSVPSVKIEKPGVVVIPVQRLAMILREVTEDSLSIDSAAGKTIVKGQRCRFELAAQNADEFPDTHEFTDSSYYEIAGGVFREMIKRTLFASDAESSRYALAGVLLEPDGEIMNAVGTDGRRLAKQTGKISTIGNPSSPTTTIVPSRALQLIERTLPDDGPVQFAIWPNYLIVKSGECVFSTRLVEGRFPRWRDVIPKRTDGNKIDMPVGPLYSAIRQAAIVSSEESRGVDFEFSAGNLVLTNSTAEVGQSVIDMPVSYDGAPLTISLDHRYVADFLRVLSPESIFSLDVVDGDNPAYCTTDDGFSYVLMPLSKDRTGVVNRERETVSV